MALALSLFYAGLGQLYCGQTKKGILYFYASLLGLLLITPGILIVLAAAYDAYRTAGRIDAGEMEAAPPSEGEVLLFFLATLSGLALFSGMIAVALLSLFF